MCTLTCINAYRHAHIHRNTYIPDIESKNILVWTTFPIIWRYYALEHSIKQNEIGSKYQRVQNNDQKLKGRTFFVYYL